MGIANATNLKVNGTFFEEFLIQYSCNLTQTNVNKDEGGFVVLQPMCFFLKGLLPVTPHRRGYPLGFSYWG